MSGLYIPRWLELVFNAGDKLHKVVHPSRWGENKPCECGRLTRGDCSKKFGPDCLWSEPTESSPPPSDIGPYPKGES